MRLAHPKKLLALALGFSFFLTPFQDQVNAAGLTDIQGDKNKTAIQWLYDRQVISGYADMTFKPKSMINRGELMKILVGAQKVDLASGDYKNCFPDVREEWFAPYVCYAQSKGWVAGYGDGNFKPEQFVTKEEAIKMLVNSRGYVGPDPSMPRPELFTDVKGDEWFYTFIYIAKDKELLEQNSGTYGVGTFITRGEIAENMYRAMIIDENQLQKFSDATPVDPSAPSEVVETPANCDAAVRGYGAVKADLDKMNVLKVPVCEGYRYTACTQNIVGNPDLFGAAFEPTNVKFEEKSAEDFIVTVNEDKSETKTPRPDCITFEPKTTDYYLGLWGSAANSKANIWMSSSKMQDVPAGFEKSLTWFADGCTELTNDKYGPFNTPWGNDEDLDRPFYDGYPNYLHGGADFACPADTLVKAMCDGFIADSDDAGGDWGWHTVVQCNGAHPISIVTIHVQKESTLPIGTVVKAGDTIGKVFPMDIPGEQVHIHLTGCRMAHADCEAAGFHPERGASRRTEWWGVSKYWFDMDWHTNPGLYKVLPV